VVRAALRDPDARYGPPDPTFAADPDVPGARAWFRAACRRRWGLGPADADVLYTLARGLTATKEIAAELHRSVHGIDDSLARIYGHLGLTHEAWAPHMPAAVRAAWRLYRRARCLASKEARCNSAASGPRAR
jgi:DNA-binding CsgD family transcriptional regulator